MSSCKILIIDDDKDDIDILADAFTKSGVESVHYVNTAMKAFMFLEQVEKEKDLPKLIVTDLYLPGITGAEFLTDLKGMDRYRHIPVIVLTSVKTEKEIERYRAMGASDYITKPTSYEEYFRVAEYLKTKVFANE